MRLAQISCGDWLVKTSLWNSQGPGRACLRRYFCGENEERPCPCHVCSQFFHVNQTMGDGGEEHAGIRQDQAQLFYEAWGEGHR